jgi:hypothetical protein
MTGRERDHARSVPPLWPGRDAVRRDRVTGQQGTAEFDLVDVFAKTTPSNVRAIC